MFHGKKTPLQIGGKEPYSDTFPEENTQGNPLCTEKAVEACWPPLTPEHGFPSLYKPGPGRSPSARRGTAREGGFTSFPDKETKNREAPYAVPPEKSTISHDFLRRHYPHQV